jgi:hypothetical protein
VLAADATQVMAHHQPRLAATNHDRVVEFAHPMLSSLSEGMEPPRIPAGFKCILQMPALRDRSMHAESEQDPNPPMSQLAHCESAPWGRNRISYTTRSDFVRCRPRLRVGSTPRCRGAGADGRHARRSRTAREDWSFLAE